LGSCKGIGPQTLATHAMPETQCLGCIEMQKVLILCYHRVNDDNHSYLRPAKVEDFERQMQYLSRVYNPVSLEQIVQHLQDGTPLLPKSIAITFDDGYRDNYENAYPILKRYSIPATIFLTTSYIGTGKIPWWDKVYYLLSQVKNGAFASSVLGGTALNTSFGKKSIDRVVRMINRLDDEGRNRTIADFASQLDLTDDNPPNSSKNHKDLMLAWEEVREMSDNGISFGGHTLTHPLLTYIPPQQAEREIYLSKKIIEEQIAKPVITFSYPVGNFDASIERMVKDAGYSAAVSMTPGYNRSDTNIYALKRTPTRFSSKFKFFPVFMAEVTGLLGYIIKSYDRIRNSIRQ
jgi:peptidoglycan/xylan/chitin deacetylase (PgdA/CDA1 family)